MAAVTLAHGRHGENGYSFQQVITAGTDYYVCEIPGKLIGRCRISYYGTWNGRNLPIYESNDGTNYGASRDSTGAAIAPTADGEQQIIGDGYGPVKQIKIGPVSGSGTSLTVTLLAEAV